MAISKKSALALAVRYSAFQEAFRQYDTSGHPDDRQTLQTWAQLLDEIQQKTGIVIANSASYWRVRRAL